MDQSQQYIQDLEKLFHASRDVLITTKAMPRIDGLCAVLALGRAFEAMPLTSLSGPSQQRKVVKSISGRQGTQFSMLPGSDSIVSELGLRDFVIGIPGYVDKSVDSVSWYVDQGRLNVVLKSNPAVPMQFDPKQFDPFYAGANFDVVCVLDVDTPTDLGNLYRQDPGMFTELPVVNISHSIANSRFGRVNVVDANVSSTSELVYEMLTALRVHMDSDTAALLLCGMEDGTEFLSQRATSRTLEIVDQLKQLVTTPFDTRTVRGQAQSQPMPIHPQGVVQPVGQVPGGMPQYGVPGTMPYPYGMPQPMATPPGMPPAYGMPPAGYPQPQQYGQAPQPAQQYPGYTPQVPPAPTAFSQFHAPVGQGGQPPAYPQYNQTPYGAPATNQFNQNSWEQPPGGNNYGQGGSEGSGGRV